MELYEYKTTRSGKSFSSDSNLGSGSDINLGSVAPKLRFSTVQEMVRLILSIVSHTSKNMDGWLLCKNYIYAYCGQNFGETIAQHIKQSPEYLEPKYLDDWTKRSDLFVCAAFIMSYYPDQIGVFIRVCPAHFISDFATPMKLRMLIDKQCLDTAKYIYSFVEQSKRDMWKKEGYNFHNVLC